MDEYFQSAVLNYMIFGNRIVDIAIAFIIFFVVFFGFKILRNFLQKKVLEIVKKSQTQIDNILYNALLNFIKFGSGFIAIVLSIKFLVLPESVDVFLHKAFITIGTLLITWLVSDILKSMIDSYFKHSDNHVKKSLLPLVRNLSKLFIWIIAFIFILSNLGYTITSLAAGLGIGGLAIAMAVKPNLEAFFASIVIFADKPFQIGDVIRFGDHSGTILRIGLRTSIIKTYSGTEMIVPNVELANSKIENITKRAGQRIDAKIGVVYETDSSDLEKAIKIIQKILEKEENVSDDIRVWFESFGDSALIISITYFIDAHIDYMNRMNTVSHINFEIKKSFEVEGINMAYPTQTLYVRNV